VRRPLLGVAGLWLSAFGLELLLRGVLQAVAIAGLSRLLGPRRRVPAVVLGVLLAALWGTLLLVTPLVAEGVTGWDLVGRLAHQGLLLGMVLGGIFARTGNLVLVAGLHGSFAPLTRLRLPGWPSTFASSLLLLVALLLVTALLSRGLLGPAEPDEDDSAG
jgi:hypothetical protein